MTATGLHRRIVVLHDSGRVDVDVAEATTFAQLTESLGLPFTPGTDRIVGIDGTEYGATAPVGDLADGALVTLISQSHERRVRGGAGDSTAPSGLPWGIALGGIAVALAALVALTQSSTLLGDSARLWCAAASATVAIALAALWSVRAPTQLSRASAGLIAPLTLSFAAAAVITPAVVQGALVAASAGLIAMTLVCIVAAIAAHHRYLRALASSVAIVLVMTSVVWALPALWGWPVATPALVTMGLGTLALRIVPATVINVPEGHFINYEHFMSHRWTVRGAVPADPGELNADGVGAYLDESEARYVGGTTAAAVLTALAAPLGLSALNGPWSVASIGALVAYVSTLAAFGLAARRIATPVLRWILRAVSLVIGASLTLAAVTADLNALVVVGILLAVAVLSIALIVPISRGTRWLRWSRLADGIEAMCIAIALPTALLGANMIQLVRTMVSS
ncbi:hypothetical protein [Demequina globuliformis]|uniref:hypothetical protein n=1 Tax=Demequina globuliformis TaxID=676202 RepID=UPI000781F172|nr:hypothetical protein [Demequina globuliformis]